MRRIPEAAGIDDVFPSMDKTPMIPPPLADFYDTGPFLNMEFAKQALIGEVTTRFVLAYSDCAMGIVGGGEIEKKKERNIL